MKDLYPHIKIRLPAKNLPKGTLKQIANSNGFAYLEHTEGQEFTTVKLARYSAITHKRFCKLLKSLKKNLSIKSLYICKSDLERLEEFKKEQNVITGNGWKSFLMLKNTEIKKVFLEHPKGAEIEVNARKKLSHNSVIPIINHGHDYIIMPYEKNLLKWTDSSLLLYPLNRFDEVYNFMVNVFHKGYCLVDWNYNSFLFTKSGLKVCDLEHVYKHDSNEKISRDLTGIGHPQKEGMEHVSCSFDTLWKSVLGLSLKEYQTLPRRQQKALRTFRWVTSILPQKAFKKISYPLQDLKYTIIYKQKSDGKYIKLTKRF